MKKALYILSLVCLSLGLSTTARAEETPAVNKLLYMYRFYYLPYSLDFREGTTVNDIFPYVVGQPGGDRLIRAEELEGLDKEWDAERSRWKGKSLLLQTEVPVNASKRISNHLLSHHIPLTRSALDGISIDERIQVNHLLQTKTPEYQSAYKQLRFLRGFMSRLEEEKFNFFMVSASWCDSCKEYRSLLESYLKAFPNPELILQSVVIEDPKEQIFDAPLLKELFPNPKRYTHESVPRFLAVQAVNGRFKVYEEGEALKELYDRFYASHRGFLDQKSTLFKRSRSLTSSSAADVAPSLSTVGR